MPNPARGEVAFSVPGEGDGERTYVLRFGNNELVSLQQALGFDQDPDSTRRFFGLLANAFRVYLPHQWGIMLREGLHRHHPDLTVEGAGDLIDALGWKRMGEHLARAFNLALEMGEDPKGQTPSPSPGPPSG